MVKINVVSQQLNDDAQAALRLAQAGLMVAEAEVTSNQTSPVHLYTAVFHQGPGDPHRS